MNNTLSWPCARGRSGLLCMKIYILIFSLFLEIVLTGCGTTIARNLKATNDNWNIEILEVKDGPNSVSGPYVYFTPTRGFKFIWLEVQIQNNTSAAQGIDLKEIDLIYDQTIVPPFYFLFDVWLYIPSSNELTLGASESVRRRLLYSIPIGKQPRVVRLPNVGDIPIQVFSAGGEKNSNDN